MSTTAKALKNENFLSNIVSLPVNSLLLPPEKWYLLKRNLCDVIHLSSWSKLSSQLTYDKKITCIKNQTCWQKWMKMHFIMLLEYVEISNRKTEFEIILIVTKCNKCKWWENERTLWDINEILNSDYFTKSEIPIQKLLSNGNFPK